MANKVTIDIIANFKDNASQKAGSLLGGLDRLDKKLAKLAGAKASPALGLRDGLSQKLNLLWEKARRFDKAGFAARLDAIDHASQTLASVSGKAERLARGTYRLTIGAVDKASRTAASAADTIKGIVGVGYNFTLGVVDKVTAPARDMVNKLNSVLGLAGAGLSGYGLVVKPVQMQVDYENLTTAFDVLLGGEDQSRMRIEELTDFAGQTPFTRDEIYKANRILQVYTGDALGETDALGGVKMVGDITAGIEGDFNSVAIWVGRLYSAMEGGRPVGEMTAALQDMGAMGSAGRARLEALTEEVASGSKTIEEAWPQAVEVFSQYEGIMEKQSNKLGNLLLGVKSFVNNTFLKRIGAGIGSELAPALTKFRAWRSENKALFAEMGDGVERFAAGLTGRAAGAVEDLAGKLAGLTGREDWQSADLFGKMKISFDSLIGQPFSAWWDGKGKSLVRQKLSSTGGLLGKGVAKTIGGLLGLDWKGTAEEGFDLGGAFLDGFTGALGGSQLRLAFGRALKRLPELEGNLWDRLMDAGRWLKINWQENIARPFSDWWDSGGKELFTEKGAELGQWLGQGLTKGAQWLSGGILSLLGIENNSVFADAAGVGESFWSSFTSALDGEAISTAIADAVTGVWGKLPSWAQLLLGGYGLSKAEGMLSPVIGFGKGAWNFGKNLAGFVGSASGGTGLLGFGANAAIALGGGDLAGGLSLGAGGLSALGLGAVGGGIAGTATVISGVGDITQAVGSQGQEQAYYGWRAGSKIGGTGMGALAGAALGSVIPGVGTLIGGLIGAGLGGIGGSFFGDGLAAWASGLDEPIEDYQKRMAGLDRATAGYSARTREAVRQTKLTGEEFQKLEAQKLSEWYGDVSLSAQEAGDMARQAFTELVGKDALARANAFEGAVLKTKGSLAELEDNWQTVQNLSWKLEAGLTLSEGEQASFLSSVDGVIASTQSYLDDKEFEITTGLRLLLGTNNNDSLISGNSAYFSQVHEELNGLQDELRQFIQESLSETNNTPFVIDLDEEKIIQDYLNQIASITERINSAGQQAKLERLNLEFGGANPNKESISLYNAKLDTYKQETISQYLDAYENGVNSLFFQHESGLINDKTFGLEQKRLKEVYNGNVSTLEQEVAQKKLDFAQPHYDKVLEDAGSLVDKEMIADLAGKADLSRLSVPGAWPEEMNWGNWLEESLDTESLQKEMDRLRAEAPMIKEELLKWKDNLLAAGEKIPQELTDGLMRMSAIERGEFSQIYASLWENLAQEAEANGLEDMAEAMRAYGRSLVGGVGEGLAEPNDMVERGASALRLFTERCVSDQFRSPFYVEAKVHVNITPIMNKVQVGFETIVDSADKALIIVGSTDTGIAEHAAGGIVRGRQLSWLDEENRGEAVIPLNPARRESALGLWEETGRLLGLGGGGEDWLPMPATQAAAAGDVTIEMGGVTVQVTMQGGTAEGFDAQELASQVAGALADRLGSTLRNMPVRV